MRSLLDSVLRDFQKIPGFVQTEEWSQVAIEFCADRHERPRPLRSGERAVYAFFRGTEWLRIGQTNYSQRFTSQHYGTKRANSTFARDIWRNKAEFGFTGNEANIDEWIFANVGRANIFLPTHWPVAVAALLEAYLHYRLNPRFEGRRQVP